MRNEGRFFDAVEPLQLDAPIRSDAIRVVCISDTHVRLGAIAHRLPPAHVLIHAGILEYIWLIKKCNVFPNVQVILHVWVTQRKWPNSTRTLVH